MHLADAFIQSDLQLHSGYTISLVCVFLGNRTHNLLRCWRNALPLSHTGTLKNDISAENNSCLYWEAKKEINMKLSGESILVLKKITLKHSML